jgi:hypothetical protein
MLKDGKVNDLGTLGTGRESAALYVNNAGEVVGFSTFDTTPDPNSFLGATIRAFIWKNGEMKELVPPGSRGSSPSGACNNQRSDLVAGNDDTGIFLWQNGIFTEIPTLGGSSAFAQCANNRGQVIGGSNLPGDPKAMVEKLNRMLTGWANYFCLGSVSKDEPRPGYLRFPEASLHSVYGLVQLPHRTANHPWANA